MARNSAIYQLSTDSLACMFAVDSAIVRVLDYFRTLASMKWVRLMTAGPLKISLFFSLCLAFLNSLLYMWLNTIKGMHRKRDPFRAGSDFQSFDAAYVDHREPHVSQPGEARGAQALPRGETTERRPTSG